MKNLYLKKWISGSGQDFTLHKINKIVSDHARMQSENKIFIGSDSYISGKRVCFATAVCLLSSNLGGKYFFYKEHVPLNRYNVLSSRITEEVRRSIEIAEFFIEENKLNSDKIELHLDVSPVGSGNKTSRFSEMLKGYVQGYGFTCRLKPNAWASQSVADRHSK